MRDVELLRGPADRLAPLFRRSTVPIGFEARHLRKHLAVAVAVDELRRNVEVEQALNSFARHRAGNNIATDDNTVHIGFTYLPEYCGKRVSVGMDVVDGSDARDETPRIAIKQMVVIYTITPADGKLTL